jgi:hypothetical protein
VPASTRTASIERRTGETSIELILNIDGSGMVDSATGIGFLDHMLHLFARHGLFDLKVHAPVICTSMNIIRLKMSAFAWVRRSTGRLVSVAVLCARRMHMCQWTKRWGLSPSI